MNTWIEGVVQHGDKQGRLVGFPSANLDAELLEHVEDEGVYACHVEVSGMRYAGALYFGPRLVMGETKRVLEIHIIDFEQEIYGEKISFCLDGFVRPPMNFASIAELGTQLQDDIAQCRKLILA